VCKNKKIDLWSLGIEQQLQRLNLCSVFILAPLQHEWGSSVIYQHHNLSQTAQFLQKRVKQVPWSASQVHLPFLDMRFEQVNPS
jgi:hypothetical protein